MSPFFRGSVRPQRRHPRPWSMNPRLNPDLLTTDGHPNERELNLAEPAGIITLPVTNSIYGKPAGFTAVPAEPPLPAPPALDARHTTGGETTQDAVVVPEINGGTAATTTTTTTTKRNQAGATITDFDPAGSAVAAEGRPKFHPGGDYELAPPTTGAIRQPLFRTSTRDSGTAMMDSHYLNDFVDKSSSGRPSPPEEATLGVPPVQGHARADSSTIGAAEARRYPGVAYETHAIESDDEEAAEEKVIPTATGGTPFETPLEGVPVGQASSWGGPTAGDIPGGFPVAGEEDPAAEERPAVLDGALSSIDETAAVGEPLMDDAQLEVSDEFKPGVAVHSVYSEPSEPSEPLVSDEQLEVSDEFKPQTTL